MQKPETYAVMQTGGKQYIVYPGKQLNIEKIDAKRSKTFQDVLLLVNGDKVQIGTPMVDGAKVKCKVVEHFKGPKTKGFVYKTGSQYRRRYGHRQQLTRVEVEEIT